MSAPTTPSPCPHPFAQPSIAAAHTTLLPLEDPPITQTSAGHAPESGSLAGVGGAVCRALPAATAGAGAANGGTAMGSPAAAAVAAPPLPVAGGVGPGLRTSSSSCSFRLVLPCC